VQSAHAGAEVDTKTGTAAEAASPAIKYRTVEFTAPPFLGMKGPVCGDITIPASPYWWIRQKWHADNGSDAADLRVTTAKSLGAANFQHYRTNRCTDAGPEARISMRQKSCGATVQC